MSQRPTFRPRLKWLSLVLVGLIVLALGRGLFAPANGAQLGQRQLELADNLTSVVTQYALSFSVTTAGSLGSIQIQFCSNDAIESDPCTAPAGFDASAAILASQTGATGFSISPASTANNIILSRPVALPVLAGTAVAYTFTGVTNPSSPGSYFVRLLTFSSTDASGNFSDYGGIAFNIANSVSVSAEVPPYLIFCTGVTITGLNCANAQGDYIDFGELSTSQARVGSSQMLVATNALNGYFISVSGTSLASGNNAITAMSVNDVSRPGTSQFGLNLVGNAAPPGGSDPTGPGTAVPVANYSQPNSYRFDSGDTLVTDAGPDDVRLFTDSYIVNVPVGQAPGIYVSTLTYVCLATF